MAEGSAKVIVLSVLLAVGAGGGTAWFMVPRMEPPGGPVVVKAEVGLEADNRRLKEEVKALQREVSEAKLQLAALKAFPRGGMAPSPAGGTGGGTDPEAERLLQDADEVSLRAALDRAAQAISIEQDRREAVVRILLDATGRMRKIQARAVSAPAGDRSAAAEGEELGRETRRKLEEALTPEQLRALDQALGAPPADEGEKR